MRATTAPRRPASAPSALFGRKAAPAPPPPPPAKPSLFGRKKAAPPAPVAAPSKPSFFGRKQAAPAPAPAPVKKQSILEAFDFSQVRSESDAILIAKARGMRKGDKMSPEQYAALRRKVGGTAGDYFKSWVEVQGKYAEKGYVAADEEAVTIPPGAIFLGLTLVGLAAATWGVVSHT